MAQLPQRLGEGGSDDASSRNVNGRRTARARARRAAAAVPARNELAADPHQTLNIHGQGTPLRHLSISFVSLG